MKSDLCISETQRKVHVVSEALALVVGVPMLLWIGTRKRELTSLEKAGLLTLALGTVVVDGALLAKWAGRYR